MIYAVAALLAILVASYWWRERKAKRALREAALTIQALQRTGGCVPIRSLN